MTFDKQTYHSIGIVLLILSVTIIGYMMISKINKRLEYVYKVLGIVPLRKISKREEEIESDDEDSDDEDSSDEEEEAVVVEEEKK